MGPSGYSFPEEIKKLREYSQPILGTPNYIKQPMNTPRMSINKVAQDWIDAGVMAYDTPMNTNNMAYHVMVPTKELNGRVKITGNEDDVWYATKSGLEELPVFFSYQKQV